MSYNGSGTFVINSAGQPVVSGTVISSTAFNALTADLATGLSTAITKDGQTTITANIPMANYKFTGLGTGSAAGDSANLSQVQSTAVKLLASVSGADTITAVGSPNVAAYVAGQMFYFVAAGANTGAVTINIDSLGAKSITRDGTTALAAGDIQSGEVCVIVYDGTQFQLVNGASQSASIVTENLTVNKATVLNESGGDNDTRIEGDTEANLMFVDASEDNIGIGTNSTDTTYRLTVQGVGTSGNPMGGICFRQGATDTLYVGSIATDNDTDVEIFNPRNGYIRFATNNLVHMLLDASGNLGLGVTPSAWSAITALQVKNAFFGGASNSAYLGANAYYDGSVFKYIATGFANRYQQDSDGHLWFTAPSGNAGDPISFTQAMTLDASGNLGLGRTDQAYRLDVQIDGTGPYIGRFNNASTSTSQYNVVRFTQGASGSAGGYIGTGGSTVGNAAFQNTFVVGTDTANDLVFNTSDAQRARITSGGVFCVNTTSAIGTEVTLFKQTAGTGTPATRIWNDSTGGNNEFIDFATEASYTSRGSITYNRTAGQVAYNTTSDVRLKDNIADAADAGSKVDALQVRQFDWKETGNHVDYGFVAQELDAVVPQAVSKPEDDEKMWAVDYSKLVPMLVKEIQSLRARVAALEGAN